MAQRLTPPPVTPIRFGLFSAALVLDSPEGEWVNGVEYTPEPLDRVAAADDGYGAGVSTSDAGDDKDVFTGGIPGDVEGGVFPLHVLFSCRPVSVDVEATAARMMELHAQYGVEEGLGRLLAASTIGRDVTPTPGTALSPEDAVAVLEREAGLRYAAQPTIHAERDLASLLSNGGVVARQSGRLETTLGTPVAAGAGYDFSGTNPMNGPDDVDHTPAAEAGTGETWLWATGPVVVRLSPTIRTVGSLPARDEGTPTAFTNDFTGFAERFVAVTFDTLAIAVLTEVPRA